MNFKSLIVIFFIVHFSDANVLKDLYSGFGENFEKVIDYSGNVFKKPANELNIRPAKPVPTTTEKPVVVKKEKKADLYELCSMPLTKSDIIFITVYKKDLKKVLPPIVIDPSVLEFAYAVEKSKKLASLIDAVASVKKYKHSKVNKIPIHLQLDPTVLKALPILNADDEVILTIIRSAKGKKSAKVVSHFVDKITAAPVIKSYY